MYQQTFRHHQKGEDLFWRCEILPITIMWFTTQHSELCFLGWNFTTTLYFFSRVYYINNIPFLLLQQQQRSFIITKHTFFNPNTFRAITSLTAAKEVFNGWDLPPQISLWNRWLNGTTDCPPPDFSPPSPLESQTHPLTPALSRWTYAQLNISHFLSS